MTPRTLTELSDDITYANFSVSLSLEAMRADRSERNVFHYENSLKIASDACKAYDDFSSAP